MNLEELLSSLVGTEEIELENVSVDAEELVLKVQQAIVSAGLPAPAARLAPEVAEASGPVRFETPIREYKGEVVEVQMGATKSEGGTRRKVIKLGGQKSLFWFEGGIRNRPVVTFDVFDVAPPLPRAIREHVEDVWDSPAEWAKKAVKLGADLVTIHLTSTDPNNQNTTPKEAARVVEDILQAVDVPLVIGGSGTPEKDPLVLEKCAEAAEGERCLLASANLDLDYKKIAQAAIKYRHNVLSWTSMNINDQKSLNRLLFDEGLPKEQIVQDPTTGALGYGLDYTYSIIERMKIGALKGDEELQMPISCGVTNAWGARESWLKNDEWGPREYRGPLWEILTGLAVLMAGADIMMMLHPTAVKTVKDVILSMTGEKKSRPVKYEDWITL
ncbi:MAG: CO dehydrogenase/acetyl-CoA synthase subunit delta [Methanobacteriota archaeon]|nr:MAG: CO dehydrogenase/acetyl-CoA synthase subunit delta [Euryarchaeota archaeon]